MRISTVFGYILLLTAHILCAKLVHSGSPNYKTIHVTRRKLPLRSNKIRFRGEIYSDGSIRWLLSRYFGYRWSNWVPVSESMVPHHLVKQMRSQLAGRLTRARQAARKAQTEDVVFPIQEDSKHYIASDTHIGEELPSTSRSSRRQFTWDEISEESPLELQLLSPVPESTGKSYNVVTRMRPALQYPGVTSRQVPARVIRRSQIRTTVATPSASLGGEDSIARYFEEQNAPPIAGRRGLGDMIRDSFRSPVPEPAPPTYERQAPYYGGGSPGRVQPAQTRQPSDYDLGRMQWMFFLTSYNQRVDNIRILKGIPPLGMKLSKNTSECTQNYYKAFQLKYLTISGMMYSKKISRSVNASIQKELRHWCSGMMTRWYNQLQEMGLVVPKQRIFNR